VPAYRGPVVDVDIHHRPRHPQQEWAAYLSDEWKRTVDGEVLPFYPIPIQMGGSMTSIPFAGRRQDLDTDPGAMPGYDLGVLRRELLDPFNVWRGILTYDVGDFEAGLNPYFTSDVCRAVNDWNLDTWLAADERLYGVIAVPTSWPEAAAAEIRRVGGHEKYVGVLLVNNALGVPFGHPVFHPVYEAAVEMGLAVLIHVANGDRVPETAGGLSASQAEYISLHGQRAMHMISSLIVHGVFEKFPSLKVLITEFGFTWLPALVWRLDEQYALLRRESPWVRRLPSEVIREHIRLGTQPVEDLGGPGGIATIVEAVEGAEDILCFSSDFPHFSMDDPSYLARALPESWHRKVFCENAAAVFGFEVPAEQLATVG
jgi:uncharacterized protein